jgi:hypothetical protein
MAADSEIHRTPRRTPNGTKLYLTREMKLGTNIGFGMELLTIKIRVYG